MVLSLTVFTQIPITQKQRREDKDLNVHLKAIQSYLGVEPDPTLSINQWCYISTKCLPDLDNVVLIVMLSPSVCLT